MSRLLLFLVFFATSLFGEDSKLESKSLVRWVNLIHESHIYTLHLNGAPYLRQTRPISLYGKAVFPAERSKIGIEDLSEMRIVESTQFSFSPQTSYTIVTTGGMGESVVSEMLEDEVPPEKVRKEDKVYKVMLFNAIPGATIMWKPEVGKKEGQLISFRDKYRVELPLGVPCSKKVEITRKDGSNETIDIELPSITNPQNWSVFCHLDRGGYSQVQLSYLNEGTGIFNMAVMPELLPQ